jgi:hypothetical protein
MIRVRWGGMGRVGGMGTCSLFKTKIHLIQLIFLEINV